LRFPANAQEAVDLLGKKEILTDASVSPDRQITALTRGNVAF